MDYVTFSAKILSKLKKLLSKCGVNPGPVIRRVLEEEVKRRVLSELENTYKDIVEELSKIPDEEIAKLTREDRER